MASYSGVSSSTYVGLSNIDIVWGPIAVLGTWTVIVIVVYIWSRWF